MCIRDSIRSQREDQIPDMIDRSFYAYTSEALEQEEFEEKFSKFQANNSNVMVEYVGSEFIQQAEDELAILEHVFSRQGEESAGFNVLVDLCGIFKKTTIFEVRDLVLRHFGPDRYKYIYHIDQADCTDRVLYLNSDTDVQFDEEFYKYLCNTYGSQLSEKVFFFIDNRNVIGKDIPFQLVYQSHFDQPLFYHSVVLAHDVDDFSKIWQAMGRSRSMNDTRFTIYKSGIDSADVPQGMADIKNVGLTRELYMLNCDRKMAGNLSSNYQTLISLFNLSKDKFYYCDEIINVFLEKMLMTIGSKVRRHQENLGREIFGKPVSSGILTHILGAKFQHSSNQGIVATQLTPEVMRELMGHIIEQKYEQRAATGDIYDDFIRFLSGGQEDLMEISYTKQQQKQKQKQSNKNQDSDIMQVFAKHHQLPLSDEMPDYYAYTLTPGKDLCKIFLNLPLAVPVFKLAYVDKGRRKCINLYPTLQFLYSHHIQAEYIDSEIRTLLSNYKDWNAFSQNFMETVAQIKQSDKDCSEEGLDGGYKQLEIDVLVNHIRQNPQYSLAGLEEGVYLIGMKDQFNVHDLESHPMRAQVQYVADEMGFILFDRTSEGSQTANINDFGPYFIEQYILMEVLSKQEVAQNVIDYYVNNKEKLQRGLANYNEAQGKGFICWRFIHDRRQAAPATPSSLVRVLTPPPPEELDLAAMAEE
eukprot:TRINITY_DN16619_c0_g1_i6.p1 TRINITY_DN16619_c0_g1~~TRINITY_DN16619_c0_g1_i6.p1  ORF type:complete len:697 (+),score=215.83 TRINITY_DN16619_c0_g1_i6:177-2267(+)